jgi:hypothetical protein
LLPYGREATRTRQAAAGGAAACEHGHARSTRGGEQRPRQRGPALNWPGNGDHAAQGQLRQPRGQRQRKGVVHVVADVGVYHCWRAFVHSQAQR